MQDKKSLITNIVKLFTFNRPLSIIIVIGVIVFGTMAYVLTPKQYNPEIIRPAFLVTVNYPGASASEVESFATRELVEKLNDLHGVDTITSYSYDGGRAVAMVVFNVGENIEKAKVQLYTKLMQSSSFAKGTMLQPVIKTINPDDVPLISIAFYSDSLIQNDVRTRAVDIMNTLKSIPDVANLSIHGGESRALLVRVDLSAMEERGVTISDVYRSIKRANIKSINKGVRDGKQVVSLEVNGIISSPENIRDIVVLPGIQLRDVASVEDAWKEQSSFVLFQKKGKSVRNAVYLSIAKRKGSNAPSVSSTIREKLKEVMLQQKYSDLKYKIVRDDGKVAEKAINGLAYNLLSSIIIVGLVLVLFLSYRPAIVVMSAIPMTLLLVFFVAFIFGESINRITLFSLILSLGLLVDSATVVVENIYRHIRSNDDSEKAVIHAVEQVGVGLVLSTITSVVVFLPVSYITGMMGSYMGPLAFFVPLALIMALVVAFVVTPFLAYTLLHNKVDSTKKNDGLLGGFFERMSNKYAQILSKILYNRKLQKKVIFSVVVALLVSLSLPILGLVHFQMLPKADKNQYYIYLDLPAGTDIVKTKKIAQKVVDIVSKDKNVVSVQTFVGEPSIVDFNGLFKGVMLRYGRNQATMRINLIDTKKRKDMSFEILSRARENIYKSKILPTATTLRVLGDPPGPPVVAAFVAKVIGPDNVVREKLARAIEKKVRATDGVVDVGNSMVQASPRLIININKDKAIEYGVDTASVADTVRLLYGPVEVSQYHRKGLSEYAPIQISLPPQSRVTLDSLDRVDVRANNGVLVPLSSVSTYQWSKNVPVITSEDNKKVTYVTAETDKRSIVYIMIDMIKSIAGYRDNGGAITKTGLFGSVYTTTSGEEYRIDWGGEWKMTLENFRDLGLAMLVALFLVYAILVAQYKSFRIPSLIMSTIPLGLVGILFGFFILDLTAGIYLTATALIGFIALVGIVVNNAILYLEYFEELKDENPDMDERDALIEAGKVRLRPIVLTSATTILGSITIVSDPVWSGLAWSIMFGLLLSTALTLVIFPTLYVITSRK